jgi:carbon monoxide dehydrogenase subunit G
MKINLNDEFVVAVPPERVFTFITTPNSFAPILPYFKELRDVANNHFIVVLEVGIPQVKGIVEVTVDLTDAQPPHSVAYRTRGRHTLGMMDQKINFMLSQIETGTKVVWQTESVVSGTLASLARGMLLPLAKRQIKSLIASVQQALNADSAVLAAH